MLITEPITMLTDYAIAVEVSVFAILLFRQGHRQKHLAIGLWAVAFGFVGFAAVLGGTCHGFTYYLGNSTVRLLWYLMIYALSFASLLMLAATAISRLSRRLQMWFLLGATLKSWVYLSWSTTHNHFAYVIVDYLSAMIAVLFLEIWAAYRGQQLRVAQWLIAGILVSGLAIGIQALQLTIGVLTANDLYHLVQCVALYLLYRGASSIQRQVKAGRRSFP